jgi:vacuolar-type H+-ATPase subunit H
LIPSLSELVQKEKAAQQEVTQAREEATKVLSKAKEDAESMVSDAEAKTRKTWEAKLPGAIEEKRKAVLMRLETEKKRLQDLAKKNHEAAVNFVLKRTLEVQE